MKLFSVLPIYLAMLCVSGSACPGGWKQFSSYCYLASSSSKTWNQAQAYCKALGGELVKINSAEENEFVLALARKAAVNSHSVTQFWVGLMWNPSVNDFIWSDYSVPIYKNWAPKEPNGKASEPCGNMWTGRTTYLPYRASGYWNDRPCGVVVGWPCGLVCKRLP